MAWRPPTGFAVLACLLVAGCSGSLGEKLGLGKRAPDEFAVVRNQPLIIPPDYDLRPPDPTARRPLPGRSDAQARAALTGVPIEQRTSGSGGTAPTGEEVLVQRTAEVQSDPAVRARLAEQTGDVANVDSELFERLTLPGPSSAGDGDLTLIRRSSTPLEDL